MTDSAKLAEVLNNIADRQSSLDGVACRDAAAALTDLDALLRIAEKRAEDAEARNDFLITELDILREKARQS